ncbi:hypothetical protein U1769_04365 [Sphingomonas sp. ZT3P38]|uniref:hypothetical protein n=1 Tax=Parasphingomonas zepuensis TaxID=3096161 RepID=UPI002FC9750D
MPAVVIALLLVCDQLWKKWRSVSGLWRRAVSDWNPVSILSKFFLWRENEPINSCFKCESGTDSRTGMMMS